MTHSEIESKEEWLDRGKRKHEGRGGGGEGEEGGGGGGVVVGEDVETGEAEGGAADINRADDPEKFAQSVVGKGAKIVGIVAIAEEAGDEAHGEEGGGDAEGDH